MAGQGWQQVLRTQAGWLLLAAALVVAFVFSALTGSSGHAFLTTAARSSAVVLLLGVSLASVHMGHVWRVFARHDSIRAGIAAGGGLAQRLSV